MGRGGDWRGGKGRGEEGSGGVGRVGWGGKNTQWLYPASCLDQINPTTNVTGPPPETSS